MADFSKSLGDKVKKARKEMGLTQAQVAERIGVDQRTIIKIENYQANPKMNVLFPLLRLLKIDPWEVFYPDEKHRSSAFRNLKLLVGECEDEEIELLLPVCGAMVEAFRKKDSTPIQRK